MRYHTSLRPSLPFVLALLVGVLALLAADVRRDPRLEPEPVEDDRPEHDVTQVTERVYTFRWRAHRNLFVITDEGVLVTDPISPAAARTLMGEIRARTDQPIRYVVYSHEHWDHVLGGAVFKEAGATFVSHAKCLPAFERRPHPDLVPPDVTFEGERLDLALGGTRIELWHLGPGHGQGMIVLLLPDERILHVVDLVSPGAVGYRSLPDYDPIELVRTLRALEERLQFERIVPGHMDPVAPAAAVARERRYFEDLLRTVAGAWERGIRSPEELVATIRLPAYAGWYGYEEWLPRNVERVWATHHMGW